MGWVVCPAAAGAVVAATGIACGVIYLTQPRADWLLGAITSPLFLICEVILAVCAAAMAGILAVLWRAGRPYRGRRRSDSGEAVIEFALAMPLLLFLALLMAQTSLVMVGNLCVHYSAFCAARSAIVTVPRNLTQDEPRNEVALGDDGSAKLQRIRMAACWALMPVSCDSENVVAVNPGTLSNGLDEFFTSQGQETPTWVDDRLARQFAYASDPDHTQIELAPPAKGATYGERENIHVTVRHKLYLSVPYAARIFGAFPGGEELTDIGAGEYATLITASSVLPNEGPQDYVDVEKFPKRR